MASILLRAIVGFIISFKTRIRKGEAAPPDRNHHLDRKADIIKRLKFVSSPQIV